MATLKFQHIYVSMPTSKFQHICDCKYAYSYIVSMPTLKFQHIYVSMPTLKLAIHQFTPRLHPVEEPLGGAWGREAKRYL